MALQSHNSSQPRAGQLDRDEDTFWETAPLLFGETFDQQARDHMEAVKSLKKTTFTPSCQPFQSPCPGKVVHSGAAEWTKNLVLLRKEKELSNICMLTAWSPLHNSGPTNPLLVSDTERSTMDLANQVGNNTNCSRAPHNSNICSLFYSNWKALSSDSWVLETVTGGYHIPLFSDPVQQFPPTAHTYHQRMW